MSWTSVPLTQNGNTTLFWTVGPHSSLSDRDAVVINYDSGSSRICLEEVCIVPNPIRYRLRVRVDGPGAVAFRFSAEQMD